MGGMQRLAPNASRSSAPATSNTDSRASASAVAIQAQAVMKALLLTRARPSFSSVTIIWASSGADAGDALGVAAGQAEHRAADHVGPPLGRVEQERLALPPPRS